MELGGLEEVLRRFRFRTRFGDAAISLLFVVRLIVR